MITAVDTNALIGLLSEGEFVDASETVLRRAYREGRVVITPIVYAELAADGHFDAVTDLDRFLDELSIQIVESSRAALFRAGERVQGYTHRRPDNIQCPSCGRTQTITL